MQTLLFALAPPDAFADALAVGLKALVVIFAVMALFGGLIALLGRLFPGGDDPAA